MACDIDEKCIQTYKDNYNITPLNDIRTLDVSQIPPFDMLCAGFPCFIAGTKVLTQKGYKNIEDVILNDTLMTHTGGFHKILNLQTKDYIGKLYDIKIKYHPSIITCTEDHPFYIREKTRKWCNDTRRYEYTFKNAEWKKAHELNTNHYFGMKINDKNIIPEFSFDKIINQHKTDKVKMKLDVLDMWFMMGYFIGDGWIEETTKRPPSAARAARGRSMNRIRFAINNNDKEYVLRRINNIFNITGKKCPSGIHALRASAEDGGNKYGCSNFLWFNILKKFGKYAHGKIIPEWVQDAPKEHIQEFINGYHTADGCITKNECYEFTTVSHNLAFGLQRLYLKLGYLFSINKTTRSKTAIIEGRIVNQRDTYHIRGYVRETKRNSSFIEDGYVWYAPFKIEKRHVEKEIVYNFEVENDNSYIVENTITHNCQPFSKAGFQNGFSDTRGTLFYNICEIVKVHRPKYMILENVRNLESHAEGATWKTIYANIVSLGYHTYEKPLILNVLHFNIPQNRERVIILCKRTDLGDLPPRPTIPTKAVALRTLTRTLDSFVDARHNSRENEIPEKLKEVKKVWNTFIQICHDNSIKIPKFPIWTDWWDKEDSGDAVTIGPRRGRSKSKGRSETQYKIWIDKNRKFYGDHFDLLNAWLCESRGNKFWVGAVRKFEWQVNENPLENLDGLLWSCRGSGIRVKDPNYIPTLVAMNHTPVYGPYNRKLVPEELLKLQSFGETFRFHKKHIYKQVGNTVNVDVIYQCADFLINGTPFDFAEELR